MIVKTLSSQDFAPYLNTSFRVVEAPEFELELAEVNDHSNARLEQFSLLFASSVSPWLQQGIYVLTHPDLDEVTLFLVPIGPEGNKMRYESVFSRFANTPV